MHNFEMFTIIATPILNWFYTDDWCPDCACFSESGFSLKHITSSALLNITDDIISLKQKLFYSFSFRFFQGLCFSQSYTALSNRYQSASWWFDYTFLMVARRVPFKAPYCLVCSLMIYLNAYQSLIVSHLYADYVQL